MRHLFSEFLKDDEGQDLVEYALLLAMIALVLASAILPALATAISGLFARAAAAF